MQMNPRGARLSTVLGGALVAALLASCGGVDPIEAPAVRSGSADFSRLAFIGDSFTAGFQSGGLMESRQKASFAYRFALQAGQAPTRFEIPAVAAPGVPRLLELQSFSPLTIAAPNDPGAPGNYQARFTNLALPRPYNNLAVPGATTAMALTTNTTGDPRQSLFYLYAPAILRTQNIPLAMVDQAATLDPTFVVVELGINDVLQGVINGQPDRMTPLESFEASYDEVLSRVSVAGTDARRPGVVLVNVPAPTAYPYMTTVPWFIVNPTTREPVLNPVTGQVIPLIGVVGGQPRPLPPGSLVTIEAIALLGQGYGIPTSLGGNGQPLPDNVVLDNETELLQARQRVSAMNAFIAQRGRQRGYPVLDLDTLLETRGAGMLIGGIEFSRDFVTGGFFSLDGIHPSNLGHAVAANALIALVNSSYGATIPYVNYNDDLRLPPGAVIPNDPAGALTAAGSSGITGPAGLSTPYPGRPSFADRLFITARSLFSAGRSLEDP